MFRELNNDKIGNVLIYFAKHGGPLYLTKALKLIYLLDERSMRDTGVPVTWLNYLAWEQGPVAVEIYNEINNKVPGGSGLAPYISLKEGHGDYSYIVAKADFSADDFTDYELNLLKEFASSYCFESSSKLIDEVHRPGGLWDLVVTENGLRELFKKGISISDKELSLDRLIQGDEYKSEAYANALESLHLQEHF